MTPDSSISSIVGFYLKLKYDDNGAYSTLEGVQIHLSLPRSTTLPSDLSLACENFSYEASNSRVDSGQLDHIWKNEMRLELDPEGLDITHFVTLLQRLGDQTSSLKFQLIDCYR